MAKLEGGHMHTIKQGKTRPRGIRMRLGDDEVTVRDVREQTSRAIEEFWNKRIGARPMRVDGWDI